MCGGGCLLKFFPSSDPVIVPKKIVVQVAWLSSRGAQPFPPFYVSGAACLILVAPLILPITF